jgi:uncharacterized protein (UPF0548 family)
MFFIRRPSRDTIERFLAESQHLPMSYGPIGLVQSSEGRSLDEASVVVGHGRHDFERAKAALIAWQQFDLGWVELWPRRSPTTVGAAVAVLIKHFGFWSLNGCKVAYHADVNGGSAFGYAYGTLSNHAESGEELFEVLLDPATEDVIYRIRATSKPQAFLTTIGQPIVRALQARFRRDSAEAMRRAVVEGVTQGGGA